jgi:hypothetical protein
VTRLETGMHRAATCALALGLVAACRKDPQETSNVTPTLATAAAGTGQPAKPADHLAKGELVEGKDTLLGLLLPRDMKRQFFFGNEGAAIGEVEPELVANYVRAHVSGGKLSVGASQTLFEDVHVGTDARPLRIKIERVRGLCFLEIWDMTPPPPPPGPSAQTDTERWRQAGFGPDGKPIDPAQLK